MSEPVINIESKVTQQSETIYASFQHANRQLDGLVAVDYFFAKEINQCLIFKPDSTSLLELNQEIKQRQWFHLLIALSASLRDGHSCLPLAQVAGKRLFTAGMNESNSETKGFLFSDLNTLTALVAELLLTDPNNENAFEQPIVCSHERLYLRRYYQFEQELKQVVRQRRIIKSALDAPSNNSIEALDDVGNIKSIIGSLFPDLAQLNDVQPSEIDWQAVAVANAINKNFAIIAGGPGTGTVSYKHPRAHDTLPDPVSRTLPATRLQTP